MLPIEYSYGIVTVLRKADIPDRFLILLQTTGSWSFPKGHAEGKETPKEAALRELTEETAITEIRLLNTPLIEETYTFKRDDVLTRKINQYFVGITDTENVLIQAKEISEYKWATYEEALATFTYDNAKIVLGKAREFLV